MQVSLTASTIRWFCDLPVTALTDTTWLFLWPVGSFVVLFVVVVDSTK